MLEFNVNYKTEVPHLASAREVIYWMAKCCINPNNDDEPYGNYEIDQAGIYRTDLYIVNRGQAYRIRLKAEPVSEEEFAKIRSIGKCLGVSISKLLWIKRRINLLSFLQAGYVT